MFGQTLIRATRLSGNVRYFKSNGALRDGKAVSTPSSSAAKTANTVPKPAYIDPEQVLGSKMHRCSAFDKWMMVWMKKYPNKEAIPDKIPLELYHKVQNYARIRTANLMILFTIAGCIWAVVTGKKEAKEGLTMGKRNEDWHAQINKEYRSSAADQPKTT